MYSRMNKPYEYRYFRIKKCYKYGYFKTEKFYGYGYLIIKEFDGDIQSRYGFSFLVMMDKILQV